MFSLTTFIYMKKQMKAHIYFILEFSNSLHVRHWYIKLYISLELFLLEIVMFGKWYIFFVLANLIFYIQNVLGKYVSCSYAETLIYYIISAQILPPGFSGISVVQSLVFCVVFSRLLFFLLSFFVFWPLHWLSFFELQLVITTLVYSNFC